MHGYRHPAHERRAAALAREVGLRRRCPVSHEVSPLMKLVSRGDTTVVDAYLSPILRRYVEPGRRASCRRARSCSCSRTAASPTRAASRARTAILSGPAGGIVGAVRTSAAAGFDRIIGFDMGGTSTDVSHYAGEFERAFETQVAGVRMRAPMMSIHTVAAGGGSILHFDGRATASGPDSAGAKPGTGVLPPRRAAHRDRRATSCSARSSPSSSRRCSARAATSRSTPRSCARKFAELAPEIRGDDRRRAAAGAVAEGFVRIAVGNMANAIKQISVQRGHDVTDYTLCCFGGAARPARLPGRRRARP